MNCPRCKTPIAPLVDPNSIVTCPGCGSRLMTRSAALRSQGGSKPAAASASPARVPAAAPAVAAAPRAGLPPVGHAISAAELPPEATLPPTPARQLAMLRRLEGTPEPPPRGDGGTKRKGPARGDGVSERGDAQEALHQLLREVQALRLGQARILALLEHGRGATISHTTHAGGDDASGLSPIRANRSKTVVLIDDDPVTRAAAVAELEQADVPVRAFDDGNAALSAIAEEKPDVIVLELGLGGEMAGKDVINMVKATMEWVDLPVVLWTREAVSSQKEARQIHGADEIVPKSAGAGALVACVITVFRRV